MHHADIQIHGRRTVAGSSGFVRRGGWTIGRAPLLSLAVNGPVGSVGTIKLLSEAGCSLKSFAYVCTKLDLLFDEALKATDIAMVALRFREISDLDGEATKLIVVIADSPLLGDCGVCPEPSWTD